jgi:hypothetical protein
MGIFVPEATLPDGNVVSNVYMSFYPETIHVFARSQQSWEYRALYHVLTGKGVYPWFATFELAAETSDPSVAPPFTFMYENLAKLYPGSINDADPPVFPASTPE